MISDYRPLYPYMLLTFAALVVALAGAFTAHRRSAWLGWATSAASLAALWLDWHAPASRPWQGLLDFGGYSKAFDGVFLATLAIVAAGSAAGERRMRFAGEYYALLIFSTMGLMLMAAGNSLLILYLGLELSTISLFALVGFAKREKRSAEAALKMFILGSVASAVILYGASILYGVMASTMGAAGSTQLEKIAQALEGMQGSYAAALWLGIVLVLAGLGFKIAAVPFHLWAPDVYEGAPATVSAYLSTASKAGGFAALIRVLLVALPAMGDRWSMIIVLLAALSMTLGNLVALSQTNLKRLLAYSGIAQAGYVLVGLSGAAVDPALATSAVLMYLFLYAFTNVGGFLVAQAIYDATGSDQVIALRGLHRRAPGLAFAMLIILFSLGGIPPLAGFVGKVYLFAAAWKGGQPGLVVLGALISVAALYYYLMVALQVYIRDPEDDRRMLAGRPLGWAIAVCVAATLAIGIYPAPWVRLGDRAGTAIVRRASTPLIGEFSSPPSVPAQAPRSVVSN
ncbi:MAG: NADH-quinone oxidoreductase subunit N [Chthonomonadales bacterium]